MRTLTGHESGVRSVAWSPDGRRLASGSGDNTGKVWEAGTGQLVRTLTGHESSVLPVAWSPDIVEHRPLLQAPDGRYEIDATARLRALGVDFLVLVECRDHVRAIERDVVQILADRKRATGAQKAILFATNGFQRGAIEYAKVHGIALVRVLDGALTYETKSADQAKPPVPPPWANTPRSSAK